MRKRTGPGVGVCETGRHCEEFMGVLSLKHVVYLHFTAAQSVGVRQLSSDEGWLCATTKSRTSTLQTPCQGTISVTIPPPAQPLHNRHMHIKSITKMLVEDEVIGLQSPEQADTRYELSMFSKRSALC